MQWKIPWYSIHILVAYTCTTTHPTTHLLRCHSHRMKPHVCMPSPSQPRHPPTMDLSCGWCPHSSTNSQNLKGHSSFKIVSLNIETTETAVYFTFSQCHAHAYPKVTTVDQLCDTHMSTHEFGRTFPSASMTAYLDGVLHKTRKKQTAVETLGQIHVNCGCYCMSTYL